MREWLTVNVHGRDEQQLDYGKLAEMPRAEFNVFLHSLYERKAEIACSCLNSPIPMHIRCIRERPPNYCIVTNQSHMHAPSCPRFVQPAIRPKANRRASIGEKKASALKISHRPSTGQPDTTEHELGRRVFVPTLTELNEAQRKAATHKEGPCLVVAAAGSGKTAMLIARIKHLIDSGVPSHKILACTFTKKAAAEMKQRLVKNIGPDGKSVTIGTIHSVAFRAVRPELGEGWKVQEPSWLIEQILEEQSDYNSHGVGPLMAPAEAMMGIAKAKADALLPSDVDEPLRQVYAGFEALKAERKYLDFADMLLHAIRMFESNMEFAKKWRARWDYILVDEFQDTNQAQWLFLLQLVGRTKNLFAVGDDWQSIFGFQGARPSLMKQFIDVFPDAKKIGLNVNYRSHDLIVELGNRVIELNSGHQIKKTVRANRDMPDDAIAQVIGVKTDIEEAQFVVNEINQIRKQNPDIPFDSFAILYRTHIQSRVYEEALVENDIPYQIIGDTHFYEGRDVSTILDYLRTTLDKTNSAVWSSLLNKPKRFIAKNVVQEVTQGGWDAVKNHDKCRAFVKTIQQLEKHKEPASAIRWLIDNVTGLVKAQEEDEPIKWVDSFINAASRFTSIEQFLQYVERVVGRNREPKNDAIQLMTIHRSKGLEFETVFVTGLAEGLLPHKKSIDEGDVREETRLCYVAITRARKNIYLLSSKMYGTKELDTSRYIHLLQNA